MRHPEKTVYFFLDECLPHQIADILNSIGHPITSWFVEFNGQQGIKDTTLIQYLGAKGYAWITKDDEAKVEHKNDIRSAGISVVWIRGLEREKGKPKKNKISTKEIHRMLTDKLHALEREIANSRTALYFLLYMKSGHDQLIPAHKQITLEHFFDKHLPQTNRHV